MEERPRSPADAEHAETIEGEPSVAGGAATGDPAEPATAEAEAPAPPDAPLDAPPMSEPSAPAPSARAAPPAPPPSASSPPASPPPALAEQLVLAIATAGVMALADVAYCIARPNAQRVHPGEMVLAALHLIAMYLPLGVAVGVVPGTLLAIVRRTPWLDPIRSALASPRAWATPRPDAFATALSSLLAIALFVPVLAAAHVHFATRYHRADLASYALAGVVLLLALAALALSAAIAIALRPLARRIGRAASLATLIVVIAIAAIAGPIVLLSRRPEIVDAYGAAPLAWGPAALLVLALIAIPLRRALSRRPARASWIAAGIALALALIAFGASASSYGGSNRVRSVVEQRAVLGRRLVTTYARSTDRDGDGYPWAFGGEDCDDGRADVYPGAPDPSGDGVDADCFAGDGSPQVDDEGDGRFGTPPPGLVRPNVLVVTIDALRPDHLGSSGYERPVSPNLDRFAESAVVFESALAPSSRSLRSIPAMWTGLYPSQVAFGGEYLFPSLSEENVTVAEALGRRGYRRTVVMGTDYFFRCDGFFQGFDDVDQIMQYRPARARPVDDALSRLRGLAGGTSPWLMWVHLFNVHQPWLNDGTPSRFGEEQIDRYDTEIVMADEQVQRLLDAVHELGLDQSTVVVIASDHGEQFYEHGALGHCTTLYEEEVRATLMIRAPGIAPRRVAGNVSMIDLAPTILNFAGVPAPRTMPARSLLPLMQGEAVDPDRMIFGELVPDGLFPFDQRYVRRGDDKLIWWVREGRFQLFDLESDPGETNDLSAERPDEAREMLGLLRAWVAQASRPEMRTEEVLARHRLDGPPASMSHALELVYPGMFTVLGFDLPRTTFAPGEVIPLDLYYRVDRETALDLFVRVDIAGPPGYRVPPHFHGNHFPIHSRYHTDRWREGEHLRDPVPIVIPPDLPTPAHLTLTLTVIVPEENARILEGISGGRTEGTFRLADIDVRNVDEREAPP